MYQLLIHIVNYYNVYADLINKVYINKYTNLLQYGVIL